MQSLGAPFFIQIQTNTTFAHHHTTSHLVHRLVFPDTNCILSHSTSSPAGLGDWEVVRENLHLIPQIEIAVHLSCDKSMNNQSSQSSEGASIELWQIDQSGCQATETPCAKRITTIHGDTVTTNRDGLAELYIDSKKLILAERKKVRENHLIPLNYESPKWVLVAKVSD